jgi:MoaA/NifB/PqqE/SkfB family radical SAM enzyme
VLILQIILISAAAWIIISFPWNDFLFLVRAVVLTGMNPLWPPQPRKLINYAAYRVTALFAGTLSVIKLPYSPVNVVISMTARCNKKCNFCYFKDQLNPPDAARLELSLEQFEKLLDHPLVSRALRINLTGGEPLLNKDLFFMIRAARKRGHIVNVVTNGLLLEKRALELLESPPNILAVSFYPEDREQVIRGLELLAGKIPVNLRFVLSRERMGDLSTLFQTAIDHSVKMVCIEHIYASTGHPLDGNTSVPVGDEQFENLKTFIQHKYG